MAQTTIGLACRVDLQSDLAVLTVLFCWPGFSLANWWVLTASLPQKEPPVTPQNLAHLKVLCRVGVELNAKLFPKCASPWYKSWHSKKLFLIVSDRTRNKFLKADTQPRQGWEFVTINLTDSRITVETNLWAVFMRNFLDWVNRWKTLEHHSVNWDPGMILVATGWTPLAIYSFVTVMLGPGPTASWVILLWTVSKQKIWTSLEINKAMMDGFTSLIKRAILCLKGNSSC